MWGVLEIDLLLLLCVLLGASAYWLNSWVLEYVLLLVCIGASCCGFELRFLGYVHMGLWA